MVTIHDLLDVHRDSSAENSASAVMLAVAITRAMAMNGPVVRQVHEPNGEDAT